MHNVPLRAWSSVHAPSPFDWLDLDKRQASAVNADDGGTWNPTYPIVLGGAGVDVTGPANFATASGQTDSSAVLSLQAACVATVTGELVMALGTSAFNIGPSAVVNFESGATVAAASRTYDATSQLTLTTTVAGVIDWDAFNPTFAGGSSLSFTTGSSLSLGEGATWTQSGATTWNGAVSFGATGLLPSNYVSPTVTRHGPWVVSTSSSVTAWRYGGATVDANAAYDVSADCYVVPSLTAPRVYTLSSSGAQDGMRITFTHLVHGATQAITFVRYDGTAIVTAPTTGPWWYTFEYRGGKWKRLAWGSGDTTMQLQN
jgi:hypothetical protein